MARKSKDSSSFGPPRKKRGRAKKYTIYFVLLALICITTGCVLSLTVFFQIETITVVGNDRYVNEEVAQVSGIRLGDNLFRFDSGEAKRQLEAAYPYFDEIYIHRRLPSTVAIEVTMEEPAVALETEEGFTLLSGEGKVLENGVSTLPEGLLRVRGLEEYQYAPGSFLGEEEGQEENYQMLQSFRAAMEATGLGNIGYLDLSDRFNITALYDGRILIYFGSEAKLEYKMNFILQMLEENIEPGFEGLIDVSIDKQLRTRPMDIEELAGDVLEEPKAPQEESDEVLEETPDRDETAGGEDAGSRESAGEQPEETPSAEENPGGESTDPEPPEEAAAASAPADEEEPTESSPEEGVFVSSVGDS